MLVYSKAHRYGVNLTRLSYQEVSELVQTKTDLSEIISENFGANASYVEGLLSRFRSNPDLVDESWRAYFTELLADSGALARPETSGNGGATKTQVDGSTSASVPVGDGNKAAVKAPGNAGN